MNYLSFKKFLAAAGLSTRRFGDLCGIGKTTVHRLAQPGHGGLTPKYVRKITPGLMRACQDHLTGAGASADAVHLILSDIFGEEFTPSIITRAGLTSDMLRFFGLARDPFAAPRNPNEVFLTEEMRHIAALLEDAVKFQGFTAVLAPVGAGKTIIKNCLIDSVAGNTPTPRKFTATTGPQASPLAMNAQRAASFQLANDSPERPSLSARACGKPPIQNPKSTIHNQPPVIISPKFADTSRITAAGIVTYILEEFQIKPRRSLLLAQRQLEVHLAALSDQGTTVALCFDECHRLSDTTLTALKNFYELGTGGFQRFLGLVLFGQPQFESRLLLPRFREIAERLAVHRLSPFSAEDTEDFLDHCLQLAHHPTPASPRPQIQGPKSEEMPALGLGTGAWAPSSTSPGSGHIAVGTTCDSGWLKIGDPEAFSHLGPETVFTEDAIRAITARATTPLAIANLAASGMIEAYRKGERQVLARFIPADPDPKTLRF